MIEKLYNKNCQGINCPWSFLNAYFTTGELFSLKGFNLTESENK